tara:strand:- start:14 stop:397 length:384 start_codon:yes stop_codon:yes gene_type:complete
MKKSILSFKAFMNEELELVGPPGGPGMSQMGMPPAGMPAPGIPSKKGKKGMPQQSAVDPLKPQPYQGWKNTPETEMRLKNLIVTQFDDPDTAEEEMPQNATWQTLNTAQGNAYQREVMKLKASQGMR